MTKIDWNEAPGWAISYSSHSTWFYWVGDKGYTPTTSPSSFYEFGSCDSTTEYYIKGDFEVIESRIPAPCGGGIPKPLYTTKMKEAGELPSVGMECLLKMTGVYLRVTIKYNSEHVIVYTYKTDNVLFEVCKSKELNHIDIKPIDPPIELINGKVYRFIYKGRTRYAPYIEDINFFSDVDMHISPDSCTNIQLLEVK